MRRSGTGNAETGKTSFFPLEVAERIAASLRARARLRVLECPSLAAERLGYSVVERDMGPGVRGRSVEGLRTIWIAPQAYLPRRTLTICHELMELALPRHWSGELRERMCQRGAAAIVLPSRAYEQAFHRARGDLAVLRRWHRWASWETLGRRAADLIEGVRFRAWADGRPRDADELTDAEVAAVNEALSRGMGVSVKHGVCAQAWALSERGADSRLVSLSVTVAR